MRAFIYYPASVPPKFGRLARQAAHGTQTQEAGRSATPDSTTHMVSHALPRVTSRLREPSFLESTPRPVTREAKE